MGWGGEFEGRVEEELGCARGSVGVLVGGVAMREGDYGWVVGGITYLVLAAVEGLEVKCLVLLKAESFIKGVWVDVEWAELCLDVCV